MDDNLVIALGDDYYKNYLEELKLKFDVTEEPLVEHLGVRYTLDLQAGYCTLAQPAQVAKVLALFGMEHCTPKDSPVMSGALPCAADCSERTEVSEGFDMQEFVGHISWLHLCTRPDIGMILKVLSRFTTAFGDRHVLFAKHLLRYLKGTINLGLTYRTGFPLYYQFFTDASHAGCVDTRRAIVSLVVKLGGNTVYWKVSFTSIVSHSSTESELMALDVGATTSQALKWLIQAMGGPVQGEVQIFVDNTSTITLASNPLQPGRNLHVHARFFYVRDLVYEGEAKVYYLPTADQVADIGCSDKGADNFLRLRAFLMGCARIAHDDSGVPRWESYEE